jgi:hypothetical protein
MRLKIGMALVTITAVSLAMAADAGATTPAEFGAKCNAAWTAKHGTQAFRLYKKGCMSAAIAAAKAARTAGDNDDDAANTTRATAACREQSPPPRRTKLARAAFHACVSAAIAAQKAYGGRPLAAGLAVVPGAPVDAAATGTATFTLNQGHGQICYDVSWTGLTDVTALHIHAVAGSAIVVPLDADAVLTDNSAKGCVQGVAKATIKAIRQHPDQYYVNVHTTAAPDGAISGTLHV